MHTILQVQRAVNWSNMFYKGTCTVWVLMAINILKLTSFEKRSISSGRDFIWVLLRRSHLRLAISVTLSLKPSCVHIQNYVVLLKIRFLATKVQLCWLGRLGLINVFINSHVKIVPREVHSTNKRQYGRHPCPRVKRSSIYMYIWTYMYNVGTKHNSRNCSN